MGWHSSARKCLFVFPPPLVGVELGHVCGVVGGLCWSSPLSALPLGQRFCEADLKLV
jgi:hypothetical protein